MSSIRSILVTGASGYIGSHVVQQALEAGYSVRAWVAPTARPGKVDDLKAKFKGSVEVVPFADFINGDYTAALRDIDAIVHVAAPLPWAGNKGEQIEGAIGGALNILRQSTALGVKRAVITSSFVTVVDTESDDVYADRVFTAKDWNMGTREQVLNEDRGSFFNYSVAKTLAEREIWKFADAHPEIDVTTINPPLVFGPYVKGSQFIKDDLTSLSSVGVAFYTNVFASAASGRAGGKDGDVRAIDVRDVARAHILALTAPSSSEVGEKRILICGPTYKWSDALKYLQATRPQLQSRLTKLEEGHRGKVATVNNSRAREVLGLSEFMGWKKTVDDSVDLILEVEESWAKAG